MKNISKYIFYNWGTQKNKFKFGRSKIKNDLNFRDKKYLNIILISFLALIIIFFILCIQLISYINYILKIPTQV